MKKEEKARIERIVCTHLTHFANGLKTKHIKQANNPEGVINLKKQNAFMNRLQNEFMYYSALVRSFDSSFGKFLEKLALEIARENYEVSQKVVGKLDTRQIGHIDDVITNYRKRKAKPEISHYVNYNTPLFSLSDAEHDSDHLLYDKTNNTYHIIELKAGGDLDSKKAPAEKRALMEQYFILRNSGVAADIKLHFATAYNKFGEENEWTQPFVEMYFAKEELLIGKSFWNFVCKDEGGFDTVIQAYNDNISIITQALEDIKKVYSI